MSTGKLRISEGGKALIVEREAIKADKLVYLAISNRPIKYKNSKSKIAYIGTTKNGIYRIASSAANKSELLWNHGIKSLTFHVLYCKRGRQSICAWKALEAGLLNAFREKYEELPKGNGRNPSKKDLKLARTKFTRRALCHKIDKFSDLEG